MLFFIISIGIIVLIVVFFSLYLRSPQFGAKPDVENLRESIHYKNGQFQNLTSTPQLTEGYSMFSIIWRALFRSVKNKEPKGNIPFVETVLKDIPLSQNVLVWFGHSSYYLQLDNKRILVDPVFSGSASPVPGMTKAMPGSNLYQVEDIPELDYLLITHDHYDHLDYKTVKALMPKVKKVICALGVANHFIKWGYRPDLITELDWYSKHILESGSTIFAEPARHFSGRTFKRNQSLWLSYVLDFPSQKIYIGGDSGYDNHFKDIGNRHPNIDLAILEAGQYDRAWKYIHMHPKEVVMAAEDLKVNRFIPVHNSKFALANHAWDAPLKELIKHRAINNAIMLTPKIGEVVNLDNATQNFSSWWEEVI